MAPGGAARRSRPLHLLGVGTALPGEPVDNEALAAELGIASEWMEAFIGTRTRHFAVDLAGGQVRWTLEDLCTDAADRALAGAGVEPDAVGFVVLATATPDALMPTTAALLADRLGIGGTPVYQLQSGCSGAVQALALARALLADGIGGGGPGLVVGGDVCAKHLDLRQDFRRLPPGTLVNYVLFGDGAGAALVGPAPGPRSPRTRAALTHLTHRLDGLGLPPGQRVEWFGAADREPDRPAAWRRARFFGVPHDLKEPAQPVPPPESALLTAARPVLERLAPALPSGQSSLVLTDERLRVLWSGGSTPGEEKCRDLSEREVGHNSAALALRTRRRAEVHGPEHFLDLWQDVSAVSVPVLAPENGQVLGTVTVASGLCTGCTPHPGAALAEATAAAVEAELLTRSRTAERVLLDAYQRAAARPGQPSWRSTEGTGC